MVLRRAVEVVVGAVLVWGSQAGAQAPSPPATVGASLDGVRVRVELSDGGAGARVTATYRLRTQAADTLLLTAVPFFGLDISGAEASSGAGSLRIEHRRSGRAIEMAVPLAPGEAALVVRYTVLGAAAARGGATDLRVPLLLPHALHARSADDFFRAELVAPAGVHVVESFPVVAALESEAGATHAMTLPVAPGLLRWRLKTGTPPLLGLPAAVDLGLVLLLGVLAVFGVRVLRRPLRER